MDENNPPLGVRPLPGRRISPSASSWLLSLTTGEWGQLRSFMIMFSADKFLVAVCRSQGDLGIIFFVFSSFSVLAAIWCWFGDLSWLKPDGPPAVLQAAWTALCNDSPWWPMEDGRASGPSRISSTFMLLPTVVFSCFVTYSSVIGSYRALGDAATELLAACYFGISLIYYYQHLLFLIIRIEASILLSMKTQFDLVIWSATLAYAMWVSSNSIALYPSHSGLVASDTGTFHMLLMFSGRLLQSGIVKDRRSRKWKWEHLQRGFGVPRSLLKPVLPRQPAVQLACRVHYPGDPIRVGQRRRYVGSQSSGKYWLHCQRPCDERASRPLRYEI